MLYYGIDCTCHCMIYIYIYIYANASKTWLVIKPKYLAQAKELFADSGVQITSEGRRHLGAALGTKSFADAFVSKKVQD